MSFSPDSTDLEKADAAMARAEATIQRVRNALVRTDGDARLKAAVEAELTEMLEALEEMRALRRGMTGPSAT